jgi:hypothetical protein
VGINLAGGTHHAFRDSGEGYCVFNDAAVAARVLQGEGAASYAKRGKYVVVTRYQEKITHKGKAWSSVDLVLSSHQLK